MFIKNNKCFSSQKKKEIFSNFLFKTFSFSCFKGGSKTQFPFSSCPCFYCTGSIFLSRNENCNSRCTSTILNSWCLQHMSRLRCAGPLGSRAYLWTSHWNHKMERTLPGRGPFACVWKQTNKTRTTTMSSRSKPVSVHTTHVDWAEDDP